MASSNGPAGKSDVWLAVYRGALGAMAVLLLAGGLVLWARMRAPAPVQILLPTPTPVVAASVTAHVSGAVARPGVYSLPSGARVADLVQAAGGLAGGADEARLNLAQRVRDEDHVHVLSQGEVLPVAASQPSSGPVDINTATLEALQTLPGIGPTKAAAIISYRVQHGPFRSVEQLLDVPGIGPSTLDGLRDLVTVGAR